MRLPSRRVALFALVSALVLGTAAVVYAVHDTGNNIVTYAPVAGSSSPNAWGRFETRISEGRIDSNLGTNGTGNGIDDGTDVWRSNASFSRLRPRQMYTITVVGRFDSSADESGVVTFITDSSGGSRIWFEFAGLARLGVSRVRLGGDRGPIVMEARRAAGGPGTIITQTGGYSGW